MAGKKTSFSQFDPETRRQMGLDSPEKDRPKSDDRTGRSRIKADSPRKAPDDRPKDVRDRRLGSGQAARAAGSIASRRERNAEAGRMAERYVRGGK